jgi:RHH-type proline utilization regulon transcriptional repressor/proline dehydrogenase/delta 1-pyrroline-5-carboxylate dehydrogenase
VSSGRIPIENIRAEMRARTLADESDALRGLIEIAGLNEDERRVISGHAADLVKTIRAGSNPHLMESFLEEYGLSTREGIALMCLAEALLRVPDADTIDALIEDKIAPSNWGRHLGQSSSSLVNASTWALMLTGKVLEDDDEGLIGALHGAVKRLSEPVIRVAITNAMKELGRQFVGTSARPYRPRRKPSVKGTPIPTTCLAKQPALRFTLSIILMPMCRLLMR